MANVAPLSNKAAARPIRGNLVMILLHADSPNNRKNI